jgi:hypothetical protein
MTLLLGLSSPHNCPIIHLYGTCTLGLLQKNILNIKRLIWLDETVTCLQGILPVTKTIII